MLKQFIQLFAETFFDKRLNSKTEFVAVQSLPKGPGSEISVQADGAWHSFIAPENGYVAYTGSAKQVLFYNLLGSGVNYATEARLFRGFIPVAKGGQVFYFIQDPGEFSVTFYPFHGTTN